jgi:hypothetical protein
MNGHTGECSMAMYRGPRVCICGAASRRADHPTRSPDSPDPQDLLDKMIVRRDVPDGEVRFVSEAECITVRSPDSPDPGHGLLHCHRCGKCICPLHEAIADDTWTEARRLCASCFDGPPRSPDSVRTPDLDVLRAALEQIDSACTVFLTMAAKYHPDGGPAPAWLDFIRERQAEARAALHPASPPQKGS